MTQTREENAAEAAAELSTWLVILDHGAVVKSTAIYQQAAIDQVTDQCAGDVYDVSRYPFDLSEQGFNILFGSSVGQEDKS